LAEVSICAGKRRRRDLRSRQISSPSLSCTNRDLCQQGRKIQPILENVKTWKQFFNETNFKCFETRSKKILKTI
jgi:hypothetical protein